MYDSYPDEFESTRIIGERQFRKAVDLFNEAVEEIEGKVDYRHTYIDFSQLEVTISKRGASKVVKTCPAAMGFAFAAGTTDGPGAFDFKQGDDKVIIYTLCLWLAVRNHMPEGIKVYKRKRYRGMNVNTVKELSGGIGEGGSA